MGIAKDVTYVQRAGNGRWRSVDGENLRFWSGLIEAVSFVVIPARTPLLL